MEEENQENGQFDELSELYLFEELFKFLKESTGIAITTAYLALILSSVAYLYILYNAFDISIGQYITFEDILVTPVKNPDIIAIFCAIIFLLYIADIGNRFRARSEKKYANQKKPFFLKILLPILWAPKKRNPNFKITAVTVTICLLAYIFVFASLEAKDLKSGQGTIVEIALTDNKTVVNTTILGTSINYVFTYNSDTKESVIYAVESVKTIKKRVKQKPTKDPAAVEVKLDTQAEASDDKIPN